MTQSYLPIPEMPPGVDRDSQWFGIWDCFTSDSRMIIQFKKLDDLAWNVARGEVEFLIAYAHVNLYEKDEFESLFQYFQNNPDKYPSGGVRFFPHKVL